MEIPAKACNPPLPYRPLIKHTSTLHNRSTFTHAEYATAICPRITERAEDLAMYKCPVGGDVRRRGRALFAQWGAERGG
eukprot:365353-Chlamydomonas_euryale.AAC.28